MAVATLAGCDIADFVLNPKPIIEQTWNLPAPSTAVSVASLLPANGSVRILPDSSAFSVTITGASTSSNALGSYCGACQSLHGTNAVKPAFNFTFANSRPLPADVVSAAVLSGSVNVQLTNGLSFDPIRVKTGPGAQGYVVIVLKTVGGQVLARDTVKGEVTAWIPGNTLNRTIPLTTGNVGSFITAELELNSPIGDHNEFMNANGIVSAALGVPTLIVGSVGLNVPGRPLTSAAETLDLSDLGDMANRVVGGALEMTIANPFAVSGTVGMRFAYGPAPSQAISRTVTFTGSGPSVRRVQLDSADMALLMGNSVSITTTGTVTSTGPITVTPRQAIAIDNRMILTIRVGGGN